jgi:superfamily II DNA/RNA helicase
MVDSTFITNEGENTLENLFSELIKNTKAFDCLVGYFYSSGFFKIYKQLENVGKIRILIGIGTDQKTLNMLSSRSAQTKVKDTTSEIKKELEIKIVKEYEESKEELEIEEGAKKFVEWIKNKKLEIKAYPEQNIHAKLYIFTSKGGGFGDVGRVITGSSNLTEAGLNKNIEFNVVLKNKEQYEEVLKKFESLWKDATDVSEKYVQTIRTKTWMNDEISPFYLFLKFLYEYLKERINEDLEQLGDDGFRPEKFMDLKYQLDAVKDAKSKVLEYGGVFLSDVVGLGKTYIATMLAKEFEFIDGQNASTLVIAPPILVDESNPGSWNKAFWDFGVRRGTFRSRGILDKIIKDGTDHYKTVIIDESHGFRNEATQQYEDLFKICKGKRVILVTATPLNNTPTDILSQIKLFQFSRRSTLPNPEVRDLENFFKKLQLRLKGLDRQTDKDNYIKIVKENAKEIREKVLKYLMVRRTRKSIETYYSEDLKQQGLNFPAVEDPKPIIYQFDKELDEIFNKTLGLITKNFNYARYKPLLYLKNQTQLTNLEKGSQRNMGNFMKGVLLKRLESSFYAFKKTIDRFIQSHDSFIKTYEKKDTVYFSKKHIHEILDCIESEDDDALQELLDNKMAREFKSSDFRKEFIEDLKKDFSTLQQIQKLWKNVDYDPKLEEFERILSKDPILKKNKIIVFTESKETAEYLEQELKMSLKSSIRSFSSRSDDNLRAEVIENFDARKKDRNTIKILVTTDILSQGVNLHRSPIVINYDIPWNPTKMMQRVGRINRVDTGHERIYTYNFFPAGPINENVKLTEAAEAKINAFIEMLGNDAKLLTDEEIKSHDLFLKLNSKESIIQDENESEDTELKYLVHLRKIRDNNKELYSKIQSLPKKARTSRNSQKGNSVITFFKKGKLKKIFISSNNETKELDLSEAVNFLECDEKTKIYKRLDKKFYELHEHNKHAFDSVFETEERKVEGKGRSNESKIIAKIKAIIKYPDLGDNDKDYLQDVLQILINGIPKKTAQKLNKETGKESDPMKILFGIKKIMTPEYFKQNPISSADISGPKEVILSEYLISEN